MNNAKLLSCIYYLNDYYSTHFVIVDINNGQYIIQQIKIILKNILNMK